MCSTARVNFTHHIAAKADRELLILRHGRQRRFGHRHGRLAGGRGVIGHRSQGRLGHILSSGKELGVNLRGLDHARTRQMRHVARLSGWGRRGRSCAGRWQVPRPISRTACSANQQEQQDRKLLTCAHGPRLRVEIADTQASSLRSDLQRQMIANWAKVGSAQAERYGCHGPRTSATALRWAPGGRSTYCRNR